jgi:nucleotide-binding universal stress UspA family protein
VVAAVDLSGLRRRVADRARIVAEEHGAELTLVHAIPPIRDVFLSPAEVKAMQMLRRDSTERLAEWLRERTDVDIDIHLRVGPPARVIAREAREADVVVAGTSSLDPGAAGPMTRRIARKSRSNLIAVRRQPRGTYRRVLVGVDLSAASRRAVGFALELAPQAEITVVYSLPLRFDAILSEAGIEDADLVLSRERRLGEARQALTSFVSPWVDRVQSLVVDGPPGETMQEVVRKRSADLVVVATRGASDDSMVLLGTVAEEVLGTAPCDVAIAHVNGTFRRP